MAVGVMWQMQYKFNLSIRAKRCAGSVAVLLMIAACPLGPTPSTSPTKTQTVDKADLVGLFASLALDQDDGPHIGYYDEKNGKLKYAQQKDKSWQLYTVDNDGDVGAFVSIALDQAGAPQLAYYDRGNHQIKWAQQEANAWTVNPVVVPHQESILSLKIDGQDRPGVLYRNDNLYTLWATVDSGGNWSSETIGEPYTGPFNDMIIDDNQVPHVCFPFWGNEVEEYAALRYAKRDPDWQLENVLLEEYLLDCAIALDNQDVPHICYFMGFPEYSLKCARRQGADDWAVTVVDDEGAVGGHLSFAIDGRDHHHLSYYDSTRNRLKYAYWNGQSWDRRVIDSEGDVGKYSSLAVDSQNRVHIAYYDSTHSSLKYYCSE